MPLAAGSGQAAPWIPQGRGQMPAKLSALLRVAAHDLYSGVDEQGHSYFDGDIGIKALFHPDDPAVAPLLAKPHLKEALQEYTMWDLRDDGRFNGSPARQIFADALWYNTGQSIHNQINQAPLRDADLSWNALNRPNVDNSTVEGFQTQADWMGLNKYEAMAFGDWGHDTLPGGEGAPVQLDDGWFNGSSLENAQNNPMHPDYELTNNIPGMKGFMQYLQNLDRQQFGGQVTGWALNNWFVDATFKTFFR